MASPVRKAIEVADNFDPQNDPTLWKFYVFNIPYPVGLARGLFMKNAKWPAGFTVDRTKRSITLNSALAGKTHVKACDDAPPCLV